jgi:MFS family permease
MGSLSRSARKITWTLFAPQSLGSASFISAATLNSILGARLGGNDAFAGLPSAVYLLGGALAAPGWSLLMDRLGRRNGLAIGIIIGAVGSGVAFGAIGTGGLLAFLGGMVLMGLANAALGLGRFAAAEVHPLHERGRAISYVVIGGTVGAITGPLMVAPSGALVMRAGFDALAGPYAVSLILLMLAAIVVFAFLRPDPRGIGQQVAESYPEARAASAPARPLTVILRQPAAALAVIAMIFGQAIMVAIMVITALHMRSHNHSLGHVSAVISAHTVGMFAFSIVSGALADRWGRGPTILLGSGMLAVACWSAMLSPDLVPLALSLFLLGLGWNLCFVGGSTLLADQLSPAERARTQGVNDLLVGLASALASLTSGIVYAGIGFPAMAALAGGMAALLLAGAAYWLGRTQRRTSTTPGVS